MSATTAAVRARYRRFADVEAVSSPVYQRLARAVADDDDVVALLAPLTWEQSRPNLLFAALRFRGIEVAAAEEALRFVRAFPDVVTDLLRTRRTQTNEVARAALLLPALALLPEPLALLDAGASAGLGLLPERWRYSWFRRHDGSEHRIDPPGARLVVTAGVSGPAPLPERVPRIVWRAGIDAQPLDPRDHVSREWLRALVWSGHERRARALEAALDVAAADPPRVEAGDLVDDLARVLADAPRDATPVVMHSRALVYLDPQRREEFRAAVAALGAHRVGLEHASVLPHLADRLPAGVADTDRVVLSLDDDALALADGHGADLAWLGPEGDGGPAGGVTRSSVPPHPRSR